MPVDNLTIVLGGCWEKNVAAADNGDSREAVQAGDVPCNAGEKPVAIKIPPASPRVAQMGVGPNRPGKYLLKNMYTTVFGYICNKNLCASKSTEFEIGVVGCVEKTHTFMYFISKKTSYDSI